MTKQKQTTNPPSEEDQLAAAIAHEAELGRSARQEWGEQENLTPLVLERLWPLLAAPIPAAFIQRIGRVQGKPYESTGIKSVQVQIDRMNAILGPAWWRDEATYEDGGTLCHVEIIVGRIGQEPLAIRRAVGGVDRASSRGNLYKGSYTNAAKLAFARLGPGHEIYLDAADFDPDVDEAAAAEQAQGEQESDEPEGELTHGLAKQLVDRAWQLGLKDKFRLAASHAAGNDIGEAGTKKDAIEALRGLPISVGQRLDLWLQRKADEEAAGG